MLPLTRLKQKSKIAWQEHDAWQPLYDEVYEFAIPHRNPKGTVNANKRSPRLFDATAIKLVSKFASQLQQDFFPPGEPFFKLGVGPLGKLVMKDNASDIEQLEVAFEEMTSIIHPFFLKGGFDNAIAEMGVDLSIGTACLLIIETGDANDPVEFLNIPITQVAPVLDKNGNTVAVYWKSSYTKLEIKEAYPEGKFPHDFINADKSNENEAVELCQDYYLMDKKWHLCVHVEKSEEPIYTQEFAEQPIICVPFSRIPGENYGRGPLLDAMPDILTLNKAKEFTLRAAALRMIGMFTYKAGSAFNPNTANIAPGAFWAVGNTGGVTGADVQKLDLGSGSLDVAQLMNADLKNSIEEMMFDPSLPERGKTPISASEVVHRLTNGKEVRFNSLTRFVQPLNYFIVHRMLGILYRAKLFNQSIKLDKLMVAIEVLSPIAMTLKMSRWKPVLEFLQVAASMQQDPRRFINLDDLILEMAKDFQVPARFMTTQEQRQQQEQQAKMQQGVAQLQEVAMKQPQLLQQMMGGAEAAPQQEGVPQ